MENSNNDLIYDYMYLVLEYLKSKDDNILIRLKEIEKQTGLSGEEIVNIASDKVMKFYDSEHNKKKEEKEDF